MFFPTPFPRQDVARATSGITHGPATGSIPGQPLTVKPRAFKAHLCCFSFRLQVSFSVLLSWCRTRAFLSWKEQTKVSVFTEPAMTFLPFRSICRSRIANILSVCWFCSVLSGTHFFLLKWEPEVLFYSPVIQCSSIVLLLLLFSFCRFVQLVHVQLLHGSPGSPLRVRPGHGSGWRLHPDHIHTNQQGTYGVD